MKVSRKHIVAPVAWILSILLLNSSVNVIERSVNKAWEEQQENFNEIESLIELISEIGLSMNDIIPENNGEDNQSLKGKQILKYIKISRLNLLYQAFKSITFNQLHIFHYQLFEPSIFIPPPEK
ncbi:MAG: hypothetical protein ACK4ON_03845 [Bacteroidia bacterium]